jgi:hypothetical protein
MSKTLNFIATSPRERFQMYDDLVDELMKIRGDNQNTFSHGFVVMQPHLLGSKVANEK